MNDKEFKEFILNRIKKDKNCIQNKNCIGDLLNYPDLLYRAIEMDIVDIINCKDNFNKEFKTRINLQGMEFESKHKKYTSVYAVCKEDKQNCKKVIAKILPVYYSDLLGQGFSAHPVYSEARILRLFSDKIISKGISPNIVYYFSSVECNLNSPLIKSLKEYKQLEKYKGDKALKTKSIVMIFAEYIKGISLAKFCENIETGKIVKSSSIASLLFQLLYTLFVLQMKFNFMHNDLHGENVLLKKTKGKKNSYWIYKLNGITYYIPDNGYQVKLWDFDFSKTFKGTVIKNSKVDSNEYNDYGIYNNFNYAYDYFLGLREFLITYNLPDEIYQFLKFSGVSGISGRNIAIDKSGNSTGRLNGNPSLLKLPTIQQLLDHNLFNKFKMKPTGKFTVLGEYKFS